MYCKRRTEQPQHAQPQHVQFDQTCVLDALFVPLHDDATGHGRRFQRDDFGQRRAADQHAAAVDGKMARTAVNRRASDLPTDEQGGLRLPHPRAARPGLIRGRGGRVGVDAFAQLFQHRFGKFQHFAQVAQRTARLKGHHIADHGRVRLAVLLINILDDFLAAVGGKVDVDIGHGKAVDAQKTFKEQVVTQWVDAGNAQQIGHNRIGRRATPLAADALVAAPV